MDPLGCRKHSSTICTRSTKLDTESNCSDSTILYDLDSDIASQNNVVTGIVNNTVDIEELPDINQLRAELTLLGGSGSPSHDFVMPTNYTPSTPVYSPTSPAYSPSQSPFNINSDSEHGYTPPQNDSPIITRASEMFDLPNKDSDLEHDREVELISMVGNYINRQRIPIQINGVYLFPQMGRIPHRSMFRPLCDTKKYRQIICQVLLDP